MVAETFLPHVNGVSGSVLRAARHLVSQGHEVAIVAPEPAPRLIDGHIHVFPVRSFRVPGMGVDVGYPTVDQLGRLFIDLAPDVVHLASPLILGYQALRAAQDQGIPTVAIFQTDISGFARHYRLTGLSALADRFLGRLHGEATVNLAPSNASLDYLRSQGVPRLRLWGRGVDLEQFHPRWRSPELRTRWLRGDPHKTLVGYVGRLAPEKRVESLEEVARDHNIQLVVIGDGPIRSELEGRMPSALFTGLLSGAALGEAMASLDVLVAPGERETFCQVIQEAMAAGVPAVAPRIGGPADLVIHGETGLLYAPGKVADMTAAIRSMVSSPLARAMMSSCAREEVKDRTWTYIGDELIQHYRRAIACAASPREMAA